MVRLTFLLLAMGATHGPLRQSTAVTVKIGPMLDRTTYDPETGLTLHYDHIHLSQNSAAFASKTDINDLTHDEEGYYNCKLDRTDTGTLGILTLAWTDANAIPIRHDYEVMTANAWDSLYGSDALQVHVVEANDNVTLDVNGTDVEAAVWGALTASYTGEPTFGGEVGGLDPNLTLVLADTDELQTDWTNGGRLDLLIDAIKAMTDLMAVVTTTVSDANDANNFTITAGKDANDAYWMHAVMVEDADDSHSEVRWIYEYTSGRIVDVEEPFSFTPAVADNVWILGPVYGGYLQIIFERLGVSQIPVYHFDATDSGGSAGAGLTYYDASGEDP